MPVNALAQRGIGLLDVLAALLVLAVGMLGVARTQFHLREESWLAGARAEAASLARSEIETLRAEASVSSMAPRHVDATGGDGTRYRISLVAEPLEGLAARQVRLDVGWTDRRGAPQRLSLHTIVAIANPANDGALALARRSVPVAGTDAAP